jgi:hypothetical protein
MAAEFQAACGRRRSGRCGEVRVSPEELGKTAQLRGADGDLLYGNPVCESEREFMKAIVLLWRTVIGIGIPLFVTVGFLRVLGIEM